MHLGNVGMARGPVGEDTRAGGGGGGGGGGGEGGGRGPADDRYDAVRITEQLFLHNRF